MEQLEDRNSGSFCGCNIADDAIMSGPICSRVSSTTLLISGANVCVAAWKRVAVTLNICCNSASGTSLI